MLSKDYYDAVVVFTIHAMILLRKPLLIVGVVTVVALMLRLVGLSTFMTVDEEQWMLRSAGFYHNVFRNGDTGGAFMTTHPGATAMWLIGGGVVWQEGRVGFAIDTSNLRHFRLAATLPMAVVTALLIGCVAALLARLFSLRVAFWSGLFLAAEPYLVGMSQIAHLDALLALLMLCSVLSFLLYRSLFIRRYLLCSGVFVGLAMGTKLLPALWLFVFFVFVAFLYDEWRVSWVKFRHVIACVGFVFGVSMLTFWAVWPALWFTDDVVRSFNRDVPAVLTQEHVAIEISEEPIEPATFYVRTMLGRITPFVQILAVAGLLVSAVALFRSARALPVLWLVLYAVGFLVLITFVAKKADRYALPALVALPVVAGLVWSFVMPPLQRWGALLGLLRLSLWVGIVVGSSAVSLSLLMTPYAIAYNNPIFDVRPFSQQGWGEGLDEAARWLNSHPFIDRLTVASWYPGVMRTYFDGTTMRLSSWEDHRVGFVVTYRNMEGRAEDDTASNVLDEFQERTPEYVVSIRGVPYAWVYNTMGPWYFRHHVGELLPGMEVGQLMPVSIDTWQRIDIAFATFSDRQNTGDVYLHIREDINAADDIRTIVVNAREIHNEAWHTFEFEPISGSAGKIYYVALTSSTSRPGNAVTVRYTKEDVLPGQILVRRRSLEEGQQNSDFVREGDLAYRLVH